VTPQLPTAAEFAAYAKANGLDPFDLFGEPEPVVTTGRVNGRKRPRGYAVWRPQAETTALLDQVEAVLDEYADYLPLTIRQIFYRLVAAAGYPKDERAYKRLCDKLGRARRARLIDFGAIRDDQVVTARRDYYASPDDFWDAVGRRIDHYRRDRQAGQPVRVELWCEAAGMIEQLARVADSYSVSVYSAGGFVSLTGTRGIADRALARNVPTVLLHVGDFDPSGESIFTSMAEDAAAFVETDRIIETLHIEPIRVALTDAQVAAHGLPTAPAKKSDKRSAKWQGGTCQLEALPPDVLAGIVDEAIRDQLDLDLLDEQVEAEERDRIALTRALPSGEVGS
jgi:hypothetical protein